MEYKYPIAVGYSSTLVILNPENLGGDKNFPAGRLSGRRRCLVGYLLFFNEDFRENFRE